MIQSKHFTWLLIALFLWVNLCQINAEYDDYILNATLNSPDGVRALASSGLEYQVIYVDTMAYPGEMVIYTYYDQDRNYNFIIDAENDCTIQGYRNTSIYTITNNPNTNIIINNFDARYDILNFTHIQDIRQYSDIPEVKTLTNVTYKGRTKILKKYQTYTLVTLPNNQTVLLKDQTPIYSNLTDHNFVFYYNNYHPKHSPPLSRSEIAIIIVCCTVGKDCC